VSGQNSRVDAYGVGFCPWLVGRASVVGFSAATNVDNLFSRRTAVHTSIAAARVVQLTAPDSGKPKQSMQLTQPPYAPAFRAAFIAATIGSTKKYVPSSLCSSPSLTSSTVGFAS
jgi:hypothetical protein